MQTEKRRGRGRPPGPGKDDLGDLNAAADLVHKTPALRATTAYRRVNRKASPADIRRFQDKWQAQSHELLEAAAARAAAKAEPVPTERSYNSSNGGAYGGMRDLVRQVMDDPISQRLREMQDDPVQRMLRQTEEALSVSLYSLEEMSRKLPDPISRLAGEIENSPALRRMRELEDSPVMRTMRALEDSPAMRAIKALEDSPALRTIREYENSPAMRAIRDLQRRG